jgi:uncharacterized membrane protein
MAFCAKCGASLKEGMSFCGSCGAPVGAAGGSPAPAPVTGGGAISPATASSAPMASNVAALLTYVLGLITGIIFLVIEPYNKDKFVRFHAFQSIFLNVAWIVFWIALNIVGAILSKISFGLFGFVMLIVDMVLGLGFLLLWLFLMFKAYNNEKYMLPIIGSIAAQQAG